MLPVKNDDRVEWKYPLEAVFSHELTTDSSLEQISSFLDREEKTWLNYTPWKTYAYKPAVQYTIAHTQQCIFLKFYVEERFVRASHGKINDPVYEDSCVEFFISFDDTGYYNFEFNCIGTCLAAFGTGRDDRAPLPEESISKIRSLSLISRGHEKNLVSWTLTLAIPLSVFNYHFLSSLSGKQCRVNFFKCGDKLPEPHYVAWNNIETGEPDFHLPQFFGTMVFR